jgi:hypothetical protein
MERSFFCDKPLDTEVQEPLEVLGDTCKMMVSI